MRRENLVLAAELLGQLDDFNGLRGVSLFEHLIRCKLAESNEAARLLMQFFGGFQNRNSHHGGDGSALISQPAVPWVMAADETIVDPFYTFCESI